jgi:hypothetical protein
MLRIGDTAFGVGAEHLWLMPSIGRHLGDDLATPRRRFRPPLRAYSLGRVGCWHLEQMESRRFTGGDSLA